MGNSQSTKQNRKPCKLLPDPHPSSVITEVTMDPAPSLSSTILEPNHSRTRVRSASPPMREINLIGYMCHLGDDQYTAAAAATDTRNGAPVYWFNEFHSVPNTDDETRVDLVGLARRSASRSRERKQKLRQLKDTLEAMDKKQERLRKRYMEYERDRFAWLENERRKESVREGKGKGKGKGKEILKDDAERSYEEGQKEAERRDSAMTRYRRDVDKAVARALGPDFTKEFAEAMRSFEFEE